METSVKLSLYRSGGARALDRDTSGQRGVILYPLHSRHEPHPLLFRWEVATQAAQASDIHS